MSKSLKSIKSLNGNDQKVVFKKLKIKINPNIKKQRKIEELAKKWNTLTKEENENVGEYDRFESIYK